MKDAIVSEITSTELTSTGIRMLAERCVAVPYRVARRRQLKHANMVVQELISDPAGMQEVNEQISMGTRAEFTLRHALDLLKRSLQDVDRVVFLLETAATNFLSTRALKECLKLLVDGSHLPRNIQRAFRVLQRCVHEVFRPSQGKVLLPSVRKQRLLTIRPLYEAFVRQHGFSSAIIAPFATSFPMATDDVDADMSVGETLLRRAFLYSKYFRAITARSALAVKKKREWTYGDTPAKGELENTGSRYSLNINIVAHRDLRDTVESMNILRMLYYERAITEGWNKKAMNNVGLLLQNGAPGVPTDERKALSLYEQAISIGQVVESMNNLANRLCNGGDGVPKDIGRALQLYERAIENGDDVLAAANLANIYLEGKHGVTLDPDTGQEIFERLIRTTGNAYVMYKFATYLQEGTHGVANDVKRALQFYEECCKQGRADAMFSLATLLWNSADGIEKDPNRAFDLYPKAAERMENTDAMNNLG